MRETTERRVEELIEIARQQTVFELGGPEQCGPKLFELVKELYLLAKRHSTEVRVSMWLNLFEGALEQFADEVDSGNSRPKA